MMASLDDLIISEERESSPEEQRQCNVNPSAQVKVYLSRENNTKMPYQLSPELILRAEQEVNEKDSWRDRDIQALRDMIQGKFKVCFLIVYFSYLISFVHVEQSILKSREDDGFLLEFLRARRFDYDNAFCLLCDYYRLVLVSPELYPTMDRLAQLFECNVLSRTSGRSNQDEAVILLRLGLWNLQQFTFDDILSACILALESTVDGDDITQINGIIMVIDLDGFGWGHLRKFGPAMARKFIHTLENCLPIRLKAVLLINESTFASLLFAIMKPFMSEEFHSKIRFLGSSWKTILHRQIRPEILPREFGGTLPEMDSSQLYDELYEFERQKREDRKIYGFQNMGSQDLVGVIERSCAPTICGRSERFSNKYTQAQVGVDTLDTTFFRKSNTCNGYLFDYSSSTSID